MLPSPRVGDDGGGRQEGAPLDHFDVTGTILRKKNVSPEYLKLAIQEEGKERSTIVYVPRKEPVTYAPSDVNFLYLDAVVHVKGRGTAGLYHHVSECTLIRCAPNVKMIKEALALSNYTSLAPTMNMDEEELKRLVEESKSQKAAVNAIVEKITGRRAKDPPRYRAGRVRRSDLEVLERKEEEGRRCNKESADDSNGGGQQQEQGWRFCEPCQSLNESISIAPRKEAVANLPEGAGDSISANHKLTRTEYLETKKNIQAAWFSERIRRFDDTPKRFLDVGGGRGDLAVRIAIDFPDSEVVVVDSNKSSVKAGREYAAKCEVDDRIEFVCVNFTQYMQQYTAGDREAIDFVVALHACGDLSDLALHFASTFECNFVICPCCYPKRYLAPFQPYWRGLCTEVEADSLSRLVELDDHQEVSRRAMVVVNSMRRSAFEGGDREVWLEEFDRRISGRNISLVGRST